MKLFKKCRACNCELEISLFTKRFRSKDGLDTYCKKCNASKSREFTKNSNKRSIINSNYAKNNRTKILKDMRNWYSNNAVLVKAKNSLYIKNRQKTDLNFKLTRLLRSRLYHSLKKSQKSGSAVRDLGCSIEELRAHLEAKFQPGMSWDNYGQFGWHIDHIVPLCSFDLSVPEELKKACHYTNLQPLWWQDNLSKGSNL